MLFSLAAVLFFFQACEGKHKNDASAEKEKEKLPMVTIEKEAYGTTPEGEVVDLFRMQNENGMEISVITYGGIITSWTAPDRNGNYQDINLGYTSLDQYIESNPYFGAIIGRYGNRIAGGKFSLDGTDYTLATNDGSNHLHGGLKGFDKVVWSAEAQPGEGQASLKLSYTSADMEEGYPGELTVVVTYTLTNDNSLVVDYQAETTRPTIVNLTQHAYFNLSGDFSRTILDHEIQIQANEYLPVDETLIPTGELAPVGGTPFDFRIAKAIGKEIEEEDDQLIKGKGYDHCWVLTGTGNRKVASAYHPASGRYLEVFSNEPAIQFYSGNFLDGTLPAKGGGTYGHRTGFCLETQHYPDSPNQPAFPSVRLNPGETYSSQTTFKLSAK